MSGWRRKVSVRLRPLVAVLSLPRSAMHDEMCFPFRSCQEAEAGASRWRHRWVNMRVVPTTCAAGPMGRFPWFLVAPAHLAAATNAGGIDLTWRPADADTKLCFCGVVAAYKVSAGTAGKNITCAWDL